jgi:hypothetical protein
VSPRRYRLIADRPAFTAGELVTTTDIEQQIADALGCPASSVSVDEFDFTPDQLCVTVRIYAPAVES